MQSSREIRPGVSHTHIPIFGSNSNGAFYCVWEGQAQHWAICEHDPCSAIARAFHQIRYARLNAWGRPS
jgi:hypothetical protein